MANDQILFCLHAALEKESYKKSDSNSSEDEESSDDEFDGIFELDNDNDDADG